MMPLSSSSFAVLLALLAASTSAYAAANAEAEGGGLLSVELMSKFKRWTDYHQKTYDTHDEKMHRLRIWLSNHEQIEEHNSQQPAPTYTLGHNAFSDMTGEEFAEYFKLGDYNKQAAAAKMHTEEAASSAVRRRRTLEDVAPVDLPDHIDWVHMGAVTAIKNQGACGSCWAFSTTGALEGAKFLKTGELVSLSEQNLLDCDHTDLGCSGGLMDNAFKFDEKSGGLCSEKDYPYKAKQGRVCRTNCTDVPGSIVKSFVDVPPGSERALVSAIAMQPISVAIQASQFVFQFYKSGVITDDKCGKSGALDHGVLAVGYGTDLETQTPYFLVKNSWGAEWGDHGYVKIGRKSKNKYGICAILKMASFPEVE